MKASELIHLLQAAIADHGDLDVSVDVTWDSIVEAKPGNFGDDNIRLIVGHTDRADEDPRRDTLYEYVIDYQKMCIFGDGQEEDMIIGGFGGVRPLMNYTTEELLAYALDNAIIDSADDIKPRQLTVENKRAIRNDFLEWSGGLFPTSDADNSELQIWQNIDTYCEHALDAKYNTLENEVATWLRHCELAGEWLEVSDAQE